MMEKIKIELLSFELNYILSGLELIKQTIPVKELKEYILKEAKKQLIYFL